MIHIPYRFNSIKKPTAHPLTPVHMASSNEWHFCQPSSMEPNQARGVLLSEFNCMQSTLKHTSTYKYPSCIQTEQDVLHTKT
jgi:hypothetical protein